MGKPRREYNPDGNQLYVGGIHTRPWPLMEAYWLRGKCRYAVNARRNRKEKESGSEERTTASYYGYQGALDDINRIYGQAFIRFDDALPFMERVVEEENRRVRDRMAQYREEERCKSESATLRPAIGSQTARKPTSTSSKRRAETSPAQ